MEGANELFKDFLGCALMLVKVWAHNLYGNSRICYFCALWAHLICFWYSLSFGKFDALKTAEMKNPLSSQTVGVITF